MQFLILRLPVPGVFALDVLAVMEEDLALVVVDHEGAEFPFGGVNFLVHETAQVRVPAQGGIILQVPTLEAVGQTPAHPRDPAVHQGLAIGGQDLFGYLAGGGNGALHPPSGVLEAVLGELIGQAMGGEPHSQGHKDDREADMTG